MKLIKNSPYDLALMLILSFFPVLLGLFFLLNFIFGAGVAIIALIIGWFFYAITQFFISCPRCKKNVFSRGFLVSIIPESKCSRCGLNLNIPIERYRTDREKIDNKYPDKRK